MYMERTWFYVDAIITARDDNWYTILVYNLPCGKATWGWYVYNVANYILHYQLYPINYWKSIFNHSPPPLPRIWYVKWILYIVAKEIV